jgi:regulator of sigma E protease
LFWGLLITGVEDLRAVLGDIPPRTPAAVAGLQAGDEVLRVNDVEVASWQGMRLAVLQHAFDADALTFEVRTRTHAIQQRSVDLRHLDKTMLDADLLMHLGLSPIRHQPVIAFIDSAGAAAKAGLHKGDRILSVDGASLQSWADLVQHVRERPNLPVKIGVQRGAQQLSLSVTPMAVQEQGKFIGKLGVAPEVDREAMKALMTTVRYPLPEALSQAVSKTWDNSLMSLRMFWKMLTGDLSMKNLSGPVTIADYAGQAARLGVGPFVEFLAWVSISLGVLNLLPIPLLDGGHLLYYTAEIIKGSPVSERTMQIGQHAGMVLLLGLMLFAFYNDLNRLFVG